MQVDGDGQQADKKSNLLLNRRNNSYILHTTSARRQGKHLGPPLRLRDGYRSPRAAAGAAGEPCAGVPAVRVDGRAVPAQHRRRLRRPGVQGPVRRRHQLVDVVADAHVRCAERHVVPDHVHLGRDAAAGGRAGAVGGAGQQVRVGGARRRGAAERVAAVQRELVQHHHAAQLHQRAAAVAAQLLLQLALPRLRQRHGVHGGGLRAAAALLHLRGGGLVHVLQHPGVPAVLQRVPQLRGARPGGAAAGHVGPPPRAGAAVGHAQGAALPHAGRLRGRRQRHLRRRPAHARGPPLLLRARALVEPPRRRVPAEYVISFRCICTPLNRRLEDEDGQVLN
jgi:hypothetical protein